MCNETALTAPATSHSGGRELLPPAIRRARLLAWRGINVVLDIGANEGQYASRLRKAGFEGRIVSVEPGSVAFARLREHAHGDPSWDCHRLALGDRDGVVTLNIAADSEGSSLLQVESREVRNSPGSRFVGKEQVRLAQLDSVWRDLCPKDQRLYLKLDTQGSELAILSGGEHALLRTEFVEAELSLVPLYRGAPLFDEVIEFLDERGFALISLEGIDEEPATGHMLQVDAIFIRRAEREPGGPGVERAGLEPTS